MRGWANQIGRNRFATTVVAALFAIAATSCDGAPRRPGPPRQRLSIALAEDGVAEGALPKVDGALEVLERPRHGLFTVGQGGWFRYAPEPDWSGTDGVLVRARFGVAALEVAIRLDVGPVNDRPAGRGAEVHLDEDGLAAGMLDVRDPDGPFVVLAVAAPPSHGTLDLDPASGAYLYAPFVDFNGADAFTVAAFDGEAWSEPFSVELRVAPVNDVPRATPLDAVVPEDGELPGVLAGADVEEEELRFELASAPVLGSVTIDPDGQFLYRPAPDETGADAFAFTVSDGEAVSDAVVVRVNVEPRNDAPRTTSAREVVLEDQPLAGMLQAVEVDGDAMEFKVVAPPRHGALELDARGGTFVYHPDPDYAGADLFRWTADDGELTSTGAVVLDVLPVNDPPSVAGRTLTVCQGGAIKGVLDAVDVDRDPLTYELNATSSGGELSFDAEAREFRYAPAPGFAGDDAFEYVARDGLETSVPGRVGITVQATSCDRPEILHQAGDAVVVSGGTAELGVVASGVEPFYFRWWKDGVEIAGGSSPTLRLAPAAPADDGASIAVTVYDARSSVTSLAWRLGVVDSRPGVRVHRLHSNAPELFPRRHPIALRAIERAGTGVGAKIRLRSPDGGLPAATVTGAAALERDQAGNALVLSFEDDGLPEIRSALLEVEEPGVPPRPALELTYSNAAWLTRNRLAGPPRVTVTAVELPVAATTVEDWLVGQPTQEDVEFAEATWGAAVASADTPSSKARALAMAILDALVGHEGVPSDRMTRSHPFEQYRLAVEGLEQVWCTNVCAIFTLAAKSLGIPARTIAMGRTHELGGDYHLQTAESHATAEVFDSTLNRWVWIDPTLRLLGIESDGGPLDAVEAHQRLNDPVRAARLRVREYDPASGVEAERGVEQADGLPSLRRFFGPDTRLGYVMNGRVLRREFTTNEGDLYPVAAPLVIRDVAILPGEHGLLLTLGAGSREVVAFEHRETYSSDGKPDRAPRTAADGRVAIRFADADAPVAQAKQVALRALMRDGRWTPEHVVTARFYPRELYAAAGLTTAGLLVFDGDALPRSPTSVEEWLVDVPSLDEAAYAEARWGAMVEAAGPGVGERARALAAALAVELAPALVPLAPAPEGSPFELHRAVVDGSEVIDSRGLARVFSLAANALGLPARVVEMGRTISDGPDYWLMGARSRAAVEIFDEAENRWVWLDPSFQALGATLAGHGPLGAAQLSRTLADPATAADVEVLRVDPTTGTVASERVGGSQATAALATYLRTAPVLRFARGGSPAR